ncbi:uncharacterized protein LODBEIA_P58940 [Lodderomyces beijingensis]|uniref:UDENN FLCN/SMCR8-type domain-containing protein n=1 Tax=Lodderomyces beijingensis TaxID=1775926 RepID=A0ABP0ZX88_9ASCO
MIACTQTSALDKGEDHLLASNPGLVSCASCSLILPQELINMKSSTSSKTFVTTHYPKWEKRYSAATKLVMKSLSVETNLDSSKPMFFGDAINGFCLNKVFKIYDINARGQERKYSLMVMSDDESDLLQNWDIISLYFSEFISSVQQKVAETNERIHEHNLKSNKSGVNNEKYLRRSMTRPKSLVELTGDDQIFVKFHLWAIELLLDVLK